MSDLFALFFCSKVSRKRKKERKKEREEAFLIFWAHQGDQVDMIAVQVCKTSRYMFPKC